MSNLQIIEELCRICKSQSFIIQAQAAALAQMETVCMEEERVNADRALANVHPQHPNAFLVNQRAGPHSHTP